MYTMSPAAASKALSIWVTRLPRASRQERPLLCCGRSWKGPPINRLSPFALLGLGLSCTGRVWLWAWWLGFASGLSLRHWWAFDCSSTRPWSADWWLGFRLGSRGLSIESFSCAWTGRSLSWRTWLRSSGRRLIFWKPSCAGWNESCVIWLTSSRPVRIETVLGAAAHSVTPGVGQVEIRTAAIQWSVSSTRRPRGPEVVQCPLRLKLCRSDPSLFPGRIPGQWGHLVVAWLGCSASTSATASRSTSSAVFKEVTVEIAAEDVLICPAASGWCFGILKAGITAQSRCADPSRSAKLWWNVEKIAEKAFSLGFPLRGKPAESLEGQVSGGQLAADDGHHGRRWFGVCPAPTARPVAGWRHGPALRPLVLHLPAGSQNSVHCDQPGRRPFFACFSSSSLASASCEKGASPTAVGETDAGGSGSFSRGRQGDRGRRRKYEALGGLCGGDRLRQPGDCGHGDCHGLPLQVRRVWWIGPLRREPHGSPEGALRVPQCRKRSSPRSRRCWIGRSFIQGDIFGSSFGEDGPEPRHRAGEGDGAETWRWQGEIHRAFGYRASSCEKGCSFGEVPYVGCSSGFGSIGSRSFRGEPGGDAEDDGNSRRSLEETSGACSEVFWCSCKACESGAPVGERRRSGGGRRTWFCAGFFRQPHGECPDEADGVGQFARCGPCEKGDVFQGRVSFGRPGFWVWRRHFWDCGWQEGCSSSESFEDGPGGCSRRDLYGGGAPSPRGPDQPDYSSWHAQGRPECPSLDRASFEDRRLQNIRALRVGCWGDPGRSHTGQDGPCQGQGSTAFTAAGPVCGRQGRLDSGERAFTGARAPLSSLATRSPPRVNEGESPFSKLLDSRWSEVMLSHLRDAEDYVQKRRSLGKKLQGEEASSETARAKQKAKAKGKASGNNDHSTDAWEKGLQGKLPVPPLLRLMVTRRRSLSLAVVHRQFVFRHCSIRCWDCWPSTLTGLAGFCRRSSAMCQGLEMRSPRWALFGRSLSLILKFLGAGLLLELRGGRDVSPCKFWWWIGFT